MSRCETQMTDTSRFLREPLLQFLLIGVAIFGFFALLDDQETERSTDEIVITRTDMDRLAERFQATWRRPPSPQELERVIDDFVREEVFVREARSLGLDRDDAIVRQRLRRKMEFLTASAAEGMMPRDEDLALFFETNKERFDQIYLGSEVDSAALVTLRAQLDAGHEWAALAEPLQIPQTLAEASEREVDAIFGEGFFSALETLSTRGWHGPVSSGYGNHLVRIIERAPPRTPPLEAVREQVLLDWRRDKGEEFASLAFERMLERYEVVRPDKEGSDE